MIATNLNVTGLTASQLLRVNSGATAVESSGKTVPTGNIVGHTDTQTLTQKSISGANNTLTVLSAAWPIGSVFTSVVSTNPNTLLGFGTWSAIASGKMLIGLDSGDATMDTVEETGGAKTVTLTSTELPAHTHTGPSHTHTFTTASDGAHTHSFTVGDSGSSAQPLKNGGSTNGSHTTASNGAHTHTGTTDAGGTGATGSTGTGSAFSIMNPFFVVYFWKRTA